MDHNNNNMAMQETSLIKLHKQGNRKMYNVCRQGVALLRTLRNKKLRIVLNLTHDYATLNNFNRAFFGLDILPKEQHRSDEITLTVGEKDLSDERIIVIMTAYGSELAEWLIFGYLSASVVIYHGDEQPSIESPLTCLLARFGKRLKQTNIDELKNEVKFRSGFTKNPYLLCLNREESHAKAFMEYYQYREDALHDTLNQAVDTILDYFPERGAIAGWDADTARRIGLQYETSILGREIFTFEFTGSTMENLSFEFSQALNQQGNIDLLLMYGRIINSQKNSIEDQAMELYMREIQQGFFYGQKIILSLTGSNTFPLSDAQLLLDHHCICERVIQESFTCAINCMNISEFRGVYTRLHARFEEKGQELREFNRAKCQQLGTEVFDILQKLPVDCVELPTSGEVDDAFQSALNKMQIYHSQCFQIIAGGDHSYATFCAPMFRLASDYLTTLREMTVGVISQQEHKCIQQQIDIEQLKLDFKVIESERKKLEYEYELQSSILQECKLKICELSGAEAKMLFPKQQSRQIYTAEFSHLRKKVQELEQQVLDKDIKIEEMQQIIERFDGLLEKDRCKHKYAKQLTDFLKQVTANVNLYYERIEDIKHTEKAYEDIKSKLIEMKQADNIVRAKEKEENNKRIMQIELLIKEKVLLEEAVAESKLAIAAIKVAETQMKGTLNELENMFSRLNCEQAETEGELEQFKKALELLTEQIQRGKSDNLNKFYKVIKNEELRNILGTIMKK